MRLSIKRTGAAGGIVIAFIMSGCVAFGPNLEVKDLAGHTSRIPGLSLVDDGSRQTRVLAIHGMGGDRCPGYSAYRNRYSDKRLTTGAMSAIAEEMGLCLLDAPGSDSSRTQQCDESKPHTFPKEITLTKFEYAKKTSGAACAGQSVLRTYEIYYTGALESAEQDIVNRDEVVFKKQVYLNKRLKDDIVVSGLGDAVAYLGYFGPGIRAAVRDTICEMMSDSDDNLASHVSKTRSSITCPESKIDLMSKRRNIYVISHSLGSDIVFDSLFPSGANEPAGANKAAIDAFTNNFIAAYLLANQNALLDLQYELGSRSGFGHPGFEDLLLKSRVEDNGSTYAPMIVGFSDRNDMLSYALGEDVCGSSKKQCMNAVLNVARFGIPWLFVNPVTAHTGYWSDKTVIECIAKGC